MGVLELDYSQYQTVYNILSFALASMLATTVFLLAVQGRVLPRYRQALVVSAMVCLIAAYHYYRIFDSFRHSYVAVDEGSAATAMNAMSYMLVNGEGFNEGYRYVDWLLTVPLLLFEAIAVLALPRAVRKSLLMKLIPASALMIILGYPGEIAVDTAPKAIWARCPPSRSCTSCTSCSSSLRRRRRHSLARWARTSTAFAGCSSRRGASTPSPI